jgi:uncharacterized protein YdhG (YjbR/CyaY superfamily)
MDSKAGSIDEYLADVPPDMRAGLERLRGLIKAAAPQAEEAISWSMPSFKWRGPLVGFAAFKDHMSFFPMSVAVLDAHKEQLKGFEITKGSIHFTLDKQLPAPLVKSIVKARIMEQEAKGGGAPAKSPARRPRHPMPAYVKSALEDRGLMEAYKGRPPYQRNDYVGWITQARQEATRQKRLDQMLDELERGDTYMKMPYRPGKKVQR